MKQSAFTKRLTKKERISLARAGYWQSIKGGIETIRFMADWHLINAYLKTLRDGDPVALSRTLGTEVLRRGLRKQVMREAATQQRRITQWLKDTNRMRASRRIGRKRTTRSSAARSTSSRKGR